jgi:hypothetical protein
MSAIPERDDTLLREMRLVVGFCSLLVIAMGGMYAMLRTGFGVNWGALARTLGLALFLVNAPLHWAERMKKTRIQSLWYASPASGGIAAALFATLAGTGTGAPERGALLALLGGGLAISTFAGMRGRGMRWPFILTVILGALWCAGVSWGAGFENPLFLENLAVHGRTGPIDLFFHSSLANMIALHGVSSVGVDGLVGIQYHFGSHWLFNHWASLLELPILDFYQLAYPLIVPALWVTAFCCLVFEIRRFRGAAAPALPSWGVVILVIAASVIGAMPSPAWNAGGFGIGPFFSESYAVMLLFGFYVGALFVAHLARRTGEPMQFSRAETIAEYLLLLLVLPAGIVSLGIFKVSTFLFAFPALAYAILRLRLYRHPVWILSLLISAALAFMAIPHLQPSYGLEIHPFTYLRYQLPPKWWPYFLTLHFVWTWLYAAGRFAEENVTSFSTLRAAVARRASVDVEILAITSVLCLLPGVLLLLQIEALYFTDQIRWISIALLLGDIILLDKASAWMRRLRTRGFFGFEPPQIIALFVGVPLVVTFAVTLLGWPLEMVRMNLTTRKELSVLSGIPETSLKERLRTGKIFELADSRMLSAGLARASGTGLISALRSVSLLPPAERQKTALYVPQSSDAFWKLYRSDANCGWVMFVGPALAAVPMIDGFPPSDCKAPPAYGFGLEAYAQVATLPRPPVRSDADLCARAGRWHFTRVLVLAETEDKAKARGSTRNFHFRQVPCGDRL